jgi:4'-phosphopantetheinyl transferase
LLIEPLASQVPGLRLWRVPLDQALDAAVADTLSPAEVRRAEAFVRPQDRHRFRVARSALRRLLGQACGVSPAALVFGDGPFGKPMLLQPVGKTPAFSVSHSGGWGLVAFADTGTVGVDLEWPPAPPELDPLADRVFAPDERRAWSRVAPGLRAKAFLEAWTRKEACLKAWGCGLQLEPSTLSVGWPGVAAPALAVRPPPPLRAVPLRLWTLSMPDNDGAQAAVALGSAA